MHISTHRQDFGPPQVINKGFDYTIPAMDFSTLDADVAAALGDVRNMKFNEVLFGGAASCLAGDVAGCTAFTTYISNASDLANKADDILNLSQLFMTATKDALPRERSLASEIKGLSDTVKAIAASAGVLPSQNLVQATTLSGQALVSDMGYFARSLHHIGYTSHINVISEGFSTINGNSITTAAGNVPEFTWTDGISYQDSWLCRS